MHPALVAILAVIFIIVSGGCGSPAEPARAGGDARSQPALLTESEAVEAAATAFASAGIDVDECVPSARLLDVEPEPICSLTVPPSGFFGMVTVKIHARSGEVVEVVAPKWS